MKKLTLYSKPKCHLCDEMKIVLSGLKKDFEFELEEIDLESNKDMLKKYKEKIPVLMIDGRMFAKFTLDEMKLTRKLLKNV